VERLTEVQQHVVRGVDDRRDRPHAAGGEPRLDEDRRPSRTDPSHDPREVARTSLQILDLDGRHRRGRLIPLPDRDVGADEWFSGGPRHLPRDAGDRKQVRPVGFDLQIQHDVVEPHGRPEVRADRQVSRQEQDAGLVLVGDRELPGRAQHPVGDLSPERLGLQRTVEHRHPGPRSRPGDQIPGLHVPDAHDDLCRPVAAVDDRDAQLLCVRVVSDLEHAGDDDAGESLPRTFDRFDVSALQREEIVELL
jgi:hypothetical protein